MFKQNYKKYLAEMIGTAVLVLVACGVAVYSTAADGTPNIVATGLAFGLVVVAMAYAIGPISGCHINPAVSTGAVLMGRMKWKDYGFYVLFQVIGACIGGAILFGVYHLLGGTGMATGKMAETLYAGGGSDGLATVLFGITGLSTASAIILGLIVEILLTFIFVFTILGVTSKQENSKVAGLVIGLTLTLVIIAGAFFTGPSVNPARSIGSAIFAGTAALEQLWLFIVAPLIGAALAALAGRFFFKESVAEGPVKSAPEKETQKTATKKTKAA
jgi:aquaporin Z